LLVSHCLIPDSFRRHVSGITSNCYLIRIFQVSFSIAVA
jgi:hypothetical protein